MHKQEEKEGGGGGGGGGGEEEEEEGVCLHVSSLKILSGFQSYLILEESKQVTGQI
jgi:hypothetical protein